MKVFKIYKITNLVNGKCYVGQTYRTLEKRFSEHCKLDPRFCRPLTNSILKNGKENFKIELLAKCFDQPQANKIETFYIREFRSMDREFGYNRVEECDGERNFTEESIDLMRQARIKSYNSFSEEKKQKIKEKLRAHFQGLYPNKKTGLLGVALIKDGSFNIRNKRWSNVKRHTFRSARKAAICYDKLTLFLFGPSCRFNFPEKIEKWQAQDLQKFYKMMCTRRMPRNRKHKFIFKNSKQNRWIVCFSQGTRKIKSKVFKTYEEAKIWRDENFKKYMAPNQ